LALKAVTPFWGSWYCFKILFLLFNFWAGLLT